MTNLSKKLGEMNFDGLFTDVVPAVQVRGGTIRKQVPFRYAAAPFASRPLLLSHSSAARSSQNPTARLATASW